MDIAGGCGLGRIEIAMCVHPNQADLATARHAADRANRQAMIAAEDERKAAVCNQRFNLMRQIEVHLDQGLEVTQPLARRGWVELFGLWDGEVAKIAYAVAEGCQPLFDTGVAQRPRPKFDAAPPRAKIDWHSNDRDITHSCKTSCGTQRRAGPAHQWAGPARRCVPQEVLQLCVISRSLECQ